MLWVNFHKIFYGRMLDKEQLLDFGGNLDFSSRNFSSWMPIIITYITTVLCQHSPGPLQTAEV